MIVLPRGTPVKEKVNPARVNLPAALDRLGSGLFSGYMKFAADVGSGILLFAKGRMISAVFQSNKTGKHSVDTDAVGRIFQFSLHGKAELNIYRLDESLAYDLYGFLHGDYVYQGQELRRTDIGRLLSTIKRTEFTGCLRVYAEESVALIFYRQGAPLGFFHDGTSELQQTADPESSVARRPGAKLDLLATRHTEATQLPDLMATADLDALWQELRNQAS